MVLFYGSKEIVVYPSIRKSIYNRDFYFGFYCTANKEQAERHSGRSLPKPGDSFYRIFLRTAIYIEKCR